MGIQGFKPNLLLKSRLGIYQLELTSVPHYSPMTNSKPVMLSDQGLPRTKHLTIRLPMDLLNEAERQAEQDAQGKSVTDWIVQLIEQTLRAQNQAMVAITEATDDGDDEASAPKTSLMITAGIESSLEISAVGNAADPDADLRLGEPVVIEEVPTYVSNYVEDYIQTYVQNYTSDYLEPQWTNQITNQLEPINHQLEAQELNLTTLQDSLQNQIQTLQEQLNYCLGEYSA